MPICITFILEVFLGLLVLFIRLVIRVCSLLDDGDRVTSELSSVLRPFDAILMDIVMNRTDGAAVCQMLRKELSVRCPIIAMTSATAPADLLVSVSLISFYYV